MLIKQLTMQESGPLQALVEIELHERLSKCLDELPEIDEHGKNAVNWIVSHLLWIVACVLLAFVGVGIPLLLVLAVLAVVFPLVAAIKASNGETWPYPMTISFFS